MIIWRIPEKPKPPPPQVYKAIGTIAVLALAVFAAVALSRKLSTGAMAAIVGLVVGTLAGVPSALLIAAAARRVPSRPARGGQGPAAAPPVYVVNAGGVAAGPPPPIYAPLPPSVDTANGGQTLLRPRIIGDLATDDPRPGQVCVTNGMATDVVTPMASEDPEAVTNVGDTLERRGHELVEPMSPRQPLATVRITPAAWSVTRRRRKAHNRADDPPELIADVQGGMGIRQLRRKWNIGYKRAKRLIKEYGPQEEEPCDSD